MQRIVIRMTKEQRRKHRREVNKKSQEAETPPMWKQAQREIKGFGVEASSPLPVRKVAVGELPKQRGGFAHVTGGAGGASLMRTRNDGRNRNMYKF